MAIHELPPRSNRAMELFGDYWFNGDPVIVSALQGSVLLVYFWDYATAGSVRSLPYVQEWDRRYGPLGLVTAGVHTPRFAFGRDPARVERALGRLGVRFPVVMDNEGMIASRYGVRGWPTLALVDRNGFIRVQTSGEGGYQALERLLQGLLYETGLDRELPLPMEPLRETDREGALLYRATPEIYAGYARGTLGNVEGYSPESVVRYTDPGIYLDGRFYADGPWENSRDSLRYDPAAGEGAQIIVDYQGLDASGVMGGPEKTPCEVTVQQDELYLTEANRGEDVRVEADGRSVLLVGEPRVYSITRNHEYGEHVLRLKAAREGLTVYTLSFTTVTVPDLVSHS